MCALYTTSYGEEGKSATIERYGHYAAINASFATKIRGAKVGAVAIRGQQLYHGWNSYTTHPLQYKYSRNPHCIYLHAEIAAMVRAKWQADTVVVVRVLADGSWGLAKPCEGCQRALVSIDSVWYSTGKGYELDCLG